MTVVVRNLLIAPARVQTSERFTVDLAPLEGFVVVSVRNAWHKEPRLFNYFEDIAHPAVVDGRTELVVPVFMNHHGQHIRFTGDQSDTSANPWFLYFKGKGTEHFALRFSSREDRMSLLRFLGEDFGFMHTRLIPHNV